MQTKSPAPRPWLRSLWRRKRVATDSAPSPPPSRLPGPRPPPSLALQALSLDSVGFSRPPDDPVASRATGLLRYDRSLKLWVLPITSIEAVSEALGGIPVEHIPREILEALSCGDRAVQEPSCGLPEHLLPFQRAGVAFVLAREGRAMLCDEMGLGKTVQAIAAAAMYRTEWPLLVICPASLISQWAEALIRWMPDLPPACVLAIRSGRAWRPAWVAVVSYELLVRVLKTNPEAARGYGVVIADESHYLKGLHTERTKRIVPVLRAAKRALLLTGTPAMSRPIDLYPQLDALRAVPFGSLHGFALRYCNPVRAPDASWDYSGHANLHELHAVLTATVMIRRKKQDVLHELATKQRRMVAITCPAVEANMRDLSAMGQATISAAYQDTAQAKTGAVVQYLRDALAAEDRTTAPRKALIFAHHRCMLDAIEADIAWRVFRIDGDTPIPERAARIEAFNSGPPRQAALLSLTTAATGINLAAASLVIFAELHWTPAVLLQAEDRAHRIGQLDRIVDIRYLVANNTLDRAIWKTVCRKLQIVQEALDGGGEAGLGATKRQSGGARPGVGSLEPWLKKREVQVLMSPRGGLQTRVG